MQITIDLTPRELQDLVNFLAIKKDMGLLTTVDPQDFVSLLVVSEAKKAVENETKNSMPVSGNSH